MAKYVLVFLASLSVSIFVAGCSQPKPKPVEPNKPEIAEIKTQEPEPVITVPPTTQRVDVEPPPTESKEAETPPAEPAKPEPNDVKPAKVEPIEGETPVIERGESESSVMEPNTVEPKTTEPNAAEPKIAEPNEVNPPYVWRIKPYPGETPAAEPNQVQPTAVEPNAAETVAKTSFHDKCAEILSEYVDADGMVDYARLRRQRLRLKKLLDAFDELDPNEYKSWPQSDKIAFWINAYNIQMLNIIVENYPIQSSPFVRIIWGPYSILHIKGIWTDYKFIVMDEEFTLLAIEQRFFRGQFKEPRVFLALTRASLSSPVLRNEPYYGYKLDKQLEDQCRRFLSSPYGFKIDRAGQTVYVSAIFESKPTWYGGEFLDKYGTDKKFKDQEPITRAVLNFVTSYIPRGDVSFLEVSNYSIKYMKYDWTLNDSARKP
jgi:hypothetical protein